MEEENYILNNTSMYALQAGALDLLKELKNIPMTLELLQVCLFFCCCCFCVKCVWVVSFFFFKKRNSAY